MTSLLRNTTQSKNVDEIPLVTQSAENLASCLTSMLKAGARIASGDFGSSLQDQVLIDGVEKVLNNKVDRDTMISYLDNQTRLIEAFLTLKLRVIRNCSGFALMAFFFI